jgi:Arm domain-containing DNA-binding protein/integrase-like protein
MRNKITLQSVKVLKPGGALNDTELEGFQVRCQSKATVYSVRRLVGKRNLQIRIGEHGTWTPEKARKEAEAERLLRELGVGNDPRTAKIGSATLRQVSEHFMEHIRQKRQPGTARGYHDHFDQHMVPKFGNVPLD